MTEGLQKKYFSQSKNWISRIKFAEVRQKNALRTSYCNMYHYARNNPIRYIDPDGRIITWVQDDGVTDDEMQMMKNYASEIMNSDTEAGRRFLFLKNSTTINVSIKISKSGKTETDVANWTDACNGKGTDSFVNINILDIGYYAEGIKKDLRASLAHEVSGHSYNFGKGTSTYKGDGTGTWQGLCKEEQKATAMENEIRDYYSLKQRSTYLKVWDMPVFDRNSKSWYLRPGEFDRDGGYRTVPGPAEKWRP